MEKINFEVNKPVAVTLASEGVTVQGRFGDQAKFTLADGRVIYVPLFVRDRIKELAIQPGEEFSITKQETRQGNRRSVKWEVSRNGHANGSAPKDASPVSTNGTGNGANGNGKQKLGFLMQMALEKAVDAALAVEKYAATLGFCDRSGEPFRFSTEDIRAIGLSMYIDSARRER